MILWWRRLRSWLNPARTCRTITRSTTAITSVVSRRKELAPICIYEEADDGCLVLRLDVSVRPWRCRGTRHCYPRMPGRGSQGPALGHVRLLVVQHVLRQGMDARGHEPRP